MPRAKITSKGQVTIPVEVRDALALGTGDSIVLEVRGDYAVLRKSPSLVDVLDGIAERYPLPDGPLADWTESLEKYFAENWRKGDGPVVVVRSGKAPE